MKKSLLSVSLFAILAGCGGNGDSPPNLPPVEDNTPPTSVTLEITSTGLTSSWWELPQYFNGVPKYSGAFGTYTHKHIPVAVKTSQGDIFSVRTDNTQDNNFYVYAMKNNESVLIHTIENWDDPHTNAIIHVLEDGVVEVRIASRGLDHKFQTGVVLRSNTPYELDFECKEGCSEGDINYEAYPQMHETSWGKHLIYTKYEKDSPTGRNHRRLWTRYQDEHLKLSKLAHYNVSFYSDVTDKLCIASNTLVTGDPNQRVNLSVICTKGNYSEWTLLNGNSIEWDSPTEEDRIVYETLSKGTYVYLKDIIVEDGKLRVLFTESTSEDPTKGTRWLSEWIEGEGVTKIVEVGHNYSSGAYLTKEDNLYIIAGKSTSTGYLSGDLELYNKDYTLLDVAEGDYSYVRRVRYGDGEAVLSEGTSDIEDVGEQMTLEIKYSY